MNALSCRVGNALATLHGGRVLHHVEKKDALFSHFFSPSAMTLFGGRAEVAPRSTTARSATSKLPYATPNTCGRRCETHAKRPNRGKALLNANLRAPADDELLAGIADKYKPDQEIRVVQWYPGHIAKAEAALKEQLKSVVRIEAVHHLPSRSIDHRSSDSFRLTRLRSIAPQDMVLEVRDGRIPMSTRHPSIPKWVGNKPRVMVLNRRDMVSNEEADSWVKFFRERGHGVVWTNANQGDGVPSVIKQALQVSETMNEKRLARGLKPRPVRAVVIGFPNVGKSALINRLLGRRVADSAPRPGVTRSLRWMRIGGDLDLLDAPGIIPMSFKNQNAAQKLAMCNDIGEASYVASAVAAALLSSFDRLPCGNEILDKVERRYGIPIQGTEEDYVIAVADQSFNREPERAGQRILRDFRDLKFGRCCLELPDDFAKFTDC